MSTKGQKKMRVDYLTDKEKKAFRNELNERNRLIFDIGVTTGLRISDVLNLRVNQLMSEHVIITEKKTGKKRRIYISTAIREKAIDIASKEFKNLNEPLFDIDRKSVWAAFKRAAERAEIKKNIGTHSMRRSYSKRYIAKGHSLKELQKRLNHSCISDSINYITSNEDLGITEKGE